MISLVWWRKLGLYERILIILFLLSLPLVNPWVRGDGVGYYAYARALTLDHNLQFEKDWLHANPSFRSSRVDPDGRIHADQYTVTGHLDNHFTIGPALIWIPFLAIAHGTVLTANHFGSHLAADGYSWPYLDTMAIVTALCGFAGLLISFQLARKYFPERWAFLAVLGIWLASSLPVYMYFNPSWSHAQSAFAVALFLWYWDRTRTVRTWRQWCLLGLMGGLMMDMYYINVIFLLLPAFDIAKKLSLAMRQTSSFLNHMKKPACGSGLFTVALLIAFSPTLVTRDLIYGSFFATGYDPNLWHPLNPSWGRVLFSSDHGLFSWTPILFASLIGLIFLWLRDRFLAATISVAVAGFYFSIAAYVNWDGISSYGNRFFVSLTPVFVLGLASLLSAQEKLWRNRNSAIAVASAVLVLFAVWNFGMMFQWGMHLIPERGSVSWSEVISNQVRIVPSKIAGSLEQYFTGRHGLMQRIEREDLRQLGEINDSTAQPARAKE